MALMNIFIWNGSLKVSAKKRSRSNAEDTVAS